MKNRLFRRCLSALLVLSLASFVPQSLFGLPSANSLAFGAADLENKSTLSGILDIILGDSEGGQSYVMYYLHTNRGEHVRIFPDAPLPLNYQGREVTAVGIMVQVAGKDALNNAAVTLHATALTSLAVSGTRRIAMLLLMYNDSASLPNDPTYYSSLMNPTSDSVNAFYTEESYGMFSVQADVYGWYTLPKSRSYYVSGSECNGVDWNRLDNDGVAVADPYVYFPQYDDVSFVMSDHLDGCAWGGGLYLTADGVSKSYGGTWMPPWAQNVGVYAHEEGHAIGCPHTGWVYGTYDSIWDVESGGSWFNARLRGSYYSNATGRTENLYSYDPSHHVAYHKIRLGWLDGWYEEVSEGTTTFTINALAGTRISYMAVKVRIPGLDPARKYFTVEVRIKVNYDQWLPGEGVIIHSVDEDRAPPGLGGGYVPAYPVDSTPGTTTLDDAQWSVGTTYNNGNYGMSIGILSKTDNSYTVRVTYHTGSAVADLSGFTTLPTEDALMAIGDLAINQHGSKPSGINYQQGRDTTPLGYLRGMVNNTQPCIFDTNEAVNATSGRPLSSIPQTLIFGIGGPGINAVTHYYESTSNTADRAPIIFGYNSTYFYWSFTSNGTKVPGSSILQSSTAVPPGTSDVFVIQILEDADGRLVVLMYGTRYTGTWAAAEYFKFHIYPTITSWTDSYYIVRWTDAASGTSANSMPDSGDTFSILAQGTP